MRDYVVVGNKYGFPPAILYEEGVRMLPLFDQKKPGAPTESELHSMIDRLWDENNVVAKRDGEVKVKQSKKDENENEEDVATSLAEITKLILEDPDLHQKIRYNEFSTFTELLGDPELSRKTSSEWTPINDSFALYLIEKYQHQGVLGKKVSDGLMISSIKRAGRRIVVNPLKDYLTNLVWDGIPRVDNALRKYCEASGAEEYINTVSKTLFLSAVDRALNPGCKVDTMVILEGPQGVGKSTFFSILGGDYYTEWNHSVSDPNILYTMMKSWIVDISELAGLSEASVEHLKSFITTRTDSRRLAYAREAVEIPRTSIFVGTTNNNQYLKDVTGNRRFLPVKVTADKIKLDALISDRDQLWAEATHRCLAKERYWVTSDWVENWAKSETDDRLVTSDDLDEYLVKYINYEPSKNPFVYNGYEFNTRRTEALTMLSMDELKTFAPRVYTNAQYSSSLVRAGYTQKRVLIDRFQLRRWCKE
jgi:predicted P-loop ATPase